MIYLAWFILGFLGLRFFIVFLNLICFQWLQERTCTCRPKVSVLIPARNEENNIGSLLSSLVTHDYNNLEIFVYDDESIDKTASIVKEFEMNNEKVHYVKGNPLPPGWLGKNFACYNLAKQANGGYLLFLDADVVVHKGLLKNAIAHMQRKNLALFSIFPKQSMKTFGEWITVPLMNWILVTLLPLCLTRLSKRPSLSAANGQFMLFKAAVYHQNQYHHKLKNHEVEDIAIFRLMKKKRYRCHTLLSNGQVECRMYKSFNDALKGFAKNVLAFFGGSSIIALFFGILTTLGFIPVMVYLEMKFLVLYFLGVLLIWLITSFISRQNILFNILSIPIKQIAFIIVITHAVITKKRKKRIWKGRKIDV